MKLRPVDWKVTHIENETVDANGCSRETRAAAMGRQRTLPVTSGLLHLTPSRS